MKDKTTPCMLALRSGNYECQQFVKTLKPPAQSLLVTTKLIMHTPKSTSQYDESLGKFIKYYLYLFY